MFPTFWPAHVWLYPDWLRWCHLMWKWLKTPGNDGAFYCAWALLVALPTHQLTAKQWEQPASMNTYESSRCFLSLPRFLLWHRWIYHRWHRLLLARGRQRCDRSRQARVASVLYRRHPPSVQGGQVYYRWDRQRLSIFHTGTTAQGYFRTLLSVHKLGKLVERCVSSGIFQTPP